MKKILFVFIVLLLIFNPPAKADEGMWIPLLIDRLNYKDMKKMGLQLSPEEIYSINTASLKDAIVIFGRGCTGEIISDQGLLLTNHHCGYGRIQSHSTIEHDYLTNGFWAMNKEEELPNPGLTVKFLISIEDVTEKVLAGLQGDMTEEARNDKIQEISEKLQQEVTEETHYNAAVRSFFAGNEFYLFVYETYKDIRLVGAPPSSIGKFGADTDNWMWPRHTGDFSLFRVYTAPDGTPAEYSTDNIPLKPRYYLPISLDGIKKGEFSMILGYPGGTQRYLTSYGVDLAINKYNPTVVKLRREKLDIMRADMDADDGIRIKYASKYARTSNYWKYFIGQTKGLKRLKVYNKKLELEKKFEDWLRTDPGLQQTYGNALPDIRKAYGIIDEYTLSRVYYREAISRGAEILGFANGFSGLYKELTADDPDPENTKEMIVSLKTSSVKYFKDYNLPTDKKLLAAMIKMYYENIPMDQQPDYLKDMAKKYNGNFNKYADYIFKKSIFTSLHNVEAFLENPKAKKISGDPAYIAYQAFTSNYSQLRDNAAEATASLHKGNRLFVAGLREMYPFKNFYPDANFTMRLTYGTVEDYYPADAVHFNYYTTLSGVMQKEDPSTWEFVVPEKLKKLYKDKDFGEYGDNDIMNICFTTNHDITGGNSGSPVINGKGELIGLAFDGNWEAMSGDIAFEPELQRTINVDIRYVLFIIDKYAGAQNIVDELILVRSK